MFYGCESLTIISGLYKLNTDECQDISCMFANCSSLKNFIDTFERPNYILLEISNNMVLWNTEKIKNMSYLFYGCQKLLSLPDISKWNTGTVTNLSSMFY